MVGDWRLSAIWRYTTGRYLTAIYTNTAAFSANNRPDVVDGAVRTCRQASAPPPPGSTPGLHHPAGRRPPYRPAPRRQRRPHNIVIGPGLNNCDGSLSKIFLIRGERQRIVFRMDMFNIMNHPNRANPT